jgi:LDH2 family malate/lactate/ureidoglycolate dehydrogenase
MTGTTQQRVDAGELEMLVRQVFECCGMQASDAGLLADSLVSSDLRGVHSRARP